MRILIVEDNANLRTTLADLLLSSFEHVSVSGVSQGGDALRRISEKPPDIIITDIHLPGKPNGLELTRLVKTSCPDTTIVVHSEHDHPEYRQAALKHGSDFFLSKRDASAEDLMKLVGSIIRKFHTA